MDTQIDLIDITENLKQLALLELHRTVLEKMKEQATQLQALLDTVDACTT